MENLTKDFDSIMRQVSKEVSQSDTVKSFEEASKKFEQLISDGLATRRGNNLIAVDKLNLKRTQFNRS